MAKGAGNRPAEIFGYPIDNHSDEALRMREKHGCPFVGAGCDKNSRLIDYPFGVCSVRYRGQINAVCPHRLKEQGTTKGIPRVLEDVALHYFGDFNNVISFREVKLPNVGAIDYVLVRHKPMKAEIEDFVAVELQTDSTTQTGQVVQGLRDFVAGENIASQMYRFGMNTYDTIKRSMTQLSNKGIVYEAWGTKGYWVFQDYIYQNLVKRYGFKPEGYMSENALRFALYDLVPQSARLVFERRRFVSTTVDEVYQAMRNNPGLPDKDEFLAALSSKLRARLNLKFS